MCEKESGGFSTGISKVGIFTEKEYDNNEHESLIKNIKLIKGCYWSIEINQIKQS